MKRKLQIDAFLNEAFTLWSFISYLVVINTECFPFSGGTRYESHTLWINKRALNIREEQEEEEYREKREGKGKERIESCWEKEWSSRACIMRGSWDPSLRDP